MTTGDDANTTEERPGVAKRVLFVVSQPFFQWRGSPIRVGFDVLALSEAGYAVDLLVPPFGGHREIPGVVIHRVRSIPGVRELPIGPSLAKVLFDILLYFRARTLMAQNDYDFLHGVEDAGAVCACLRKRGRHRFVFEKHSDPSSYKKGFFRNLVMACYTAVERWVIRRADAVIGTGTELAHYANRVSPHVRAIAIPDIPSSLATCSREQALAARGRYVSDDQSILVTYVGSFAVYQGIDLLFASVPLVCRELETVKFLIIGGSGDEIAARRASLESIGFGDRVIFAGKIPPDELPAVLAGSDILLSPRIAGTNTPLKLLDYLKAGRAIVATDHAANRQILDETMAVFSSLEADAFAEAIVTLATNSLLREELAEGGKALLAEKYNYHYFKSSLEELYQEL